MRQSSPTAASRMLPVNFLLLFPEFAPWHLSNSVFQALAGLPNGVSGPVAASDPAVAAIKAESAKKGKNAGTPPLASAPSLPLPSDDQVQQLFL